MAMEEVLDSVRRIVMKWASTTTLLEQDITRGDTVICVKNANRFSRGDSVMLKDNQYYETGLTISEVDTDAGLITLTSEVLNNWSSSDNVVLIKTIYEQFVQGIYIGSPEVIPRYPAITVNGISRSSEWLTLESTKERYEIEIGVFVRASTQENGYRFLLNMVDEIQAGLKRNIIPLVGDYDIISLKEDIASGDVTLKVSDRDKLEDYRRIIIEDSYETQENWVTYLYTEDEDPDEDTVMLHEPACWAFDKDETSIIVPRRFIFNSWPATIEYGTIHKGELLKAATIRWFAEEEEMQWFRRNELKLN